MTTKKTKKGKTMALTDFLADERKTITVRATNWSEIVDNEEAESVPLVVDIGNLPTAPRGAVDIDYSTIPNIPPFVAHVANLSFEIDDEHLRRIFGDLNPKSARVMRDGARSRGVGLVEFETREDLINALKRSDKEFNGRKIRVNVSDKTDSHQQEGGRGGFGGNNRSNRGGEERPEMGTTWKRAEPRSDEASDDRSSSGFNRDRQNRSDVGRSHMGGGSRDNQQGNDYGFGYPRARDDRGGHSSGGGGGRDRDRDQNRQGQRNRYPDDNNRSNNELDRPRYGGRFSDTRDTRDRNRNNDDTRDNQQEVPRERQRLQLQPRTKLLEEQQPLSGSSSSVNNVAANAAQSSALNPDEPSSPTVNTSSRQTEDSSINESRDDYQQQESHDSTDNTSEVNQSEEQSTVKPSRGAGASIFGGAKPVDTAARELEIEKKLKELKTVDNEASVDSEEKGSSSRPSYERRGDREVYQSKRSSQNEDHHTRDRERDRRDDDRSGNNRDYHHRREYSGGRRFEDEGRKGGDDDDFQRRGGAQDRNRHGGPTRRDQDSGRTGNYNHHNQSQRDSDRGNAWTRNRDGRNSDTNEPNNSGRSSNNNNFNTESQPRNPQRGTVRRTQPTEDDSNRLQLSNKFVMLDDDNLDGDSEKEETQSPSIDD